MSYTAEAIEVLSGLDPVRKRPGMYTDTSRPNHLAQEVIDNSVDEALAGHASSVQVIRHEIVAARISDRAPTRRKLTERSKVLNGAFRAAILVEQNRLDIGRDDRRAVRHCRRAACAVAAL